MGTDNIFAGLNEQQKEAVLATEGYVRVIAGAGSGKTRALTARYAYLAEELGISPANILCITFTNKAARDMTESEGIGARGYMKTPSRFLFDIDDAYITRIGNISGEIMEEHALQAVLRDPYKDAHFPVGTAVKHKVFGEGVVEEADTNTQTYMVRFLIGVKPIRFDFRNLWRIV